MSNKLDLKKKIVFWTGKPLFLLLLFYPVFIFLFPKNLGQVCKSATLCLKKKKKKNPTWHAFLKGGVLLSLILIRMVLSSLTRKPLESKGKTSDLMALVLRWSLATQLIGWKHRGGVKWNCPFNVIDLGEHGEMVYFCGLVFLPRPVHTQKAKAKNGVNSELCDEILNKWEKVLW